MIIAYDTETYEKKGEYYEPVLNTNKFVIGNIQTDTGINKFFYKKEDMLNFLDELVEKNKKRKIASYIYAHNGEYDWYAINNNNDLINNDNKYILFHPFLMIRKEKAYYLDTMAFYKTSLDEIGEMLGYKKLEMPKRIKEIDELKNYVERDVKIVVEAVKYLKNTLKELGFRPRKLMTAGQVSMTCFLTYCRRNFLDNHFRDYNKEKRIKETIKTEYPQLIRQAYRGGDNRSYNIGREVKEATYIDINGLYGDIMRKMDFPDLRSEIKVDNPEIGMFTEYMKRNIGIAQCEFELNNIEDPMLPIRFGGYQMYPENGRIKGTWTYQEIKVALQEGYILKNVFWTIKWEKCKINPLKEFIEHLYKLEKDCKDKRKRGVMKLIRNNLPGKFAQFKKSKEYKKCKRSECEELIKEGFTIKSKINGDYIMMKVTDDYNPSYVNPIISTLITADGKLRLHKERKKIPKEDRLYNDTDSLIFKHTEENFKKFEIGNELGEFKVEKDKEGNELKKVPFKCLGEKKYYIGNEVKISGLTKRESTKDKIEEEKEYTVMRMNGILGAIEKNKWDSIGEFDKRIFNIKEGNKEMIDLPEYIDETIIRME